MDISLHLDDQHAICHVSDVLDIERVPEYQRVARELVGVPHALIDLSDVRNVDEAGLNALVGTVRRARRGNGHLVVVCPPGPVRDTLRIVGFDKIVEVADTLEAGIFSLFEMRDALSPQVEETLQEAV